MTDQCYSQLIKQINNAIRHGRELITQDLDVENLVAWQRSAVQLLRQHPDPDTVLRFSVHARNIVENRYRVSLPEIVVSELENCIRVLEVAVCALKASAVPSVSIRRPNLHPYELKPRAELVVVTVNEHETQAVHDAFLQATGVESVPVPLDARLYHNLGAINGTTVYHAISEMGSSGPGAMQQSVDKAIRALSPEAVIAVGVAFGANEKAQSIGDILLSKQLQLYELQRAGVQIVLRGDKPHATPRLINHFDTFNQVKWKGAKVHSGLILTGEKLIDDQDYRDQLLGLEVEAIGGEMEGAGLYVASADHKVDWIVIKAICDWADGNKKLNKKQRQKKAARNAAEFLVQSLKHASL